MEKQKKKMEFPHTIIVILSMAIFFAILTWIVPAGLYETESIDGRTRYIAGSYHEIEQTPIGPWALMMALAKGFTNNSAIFFMILIAGGAIHMIEETKCLEVLFKKLAKLPSQYGVLIVFAVMAFMTGVGSTGAFSNPIVALMPIGMMLAGALGYDKTLGFIMIYLGAFAGFNVGPTNVFTIGIMHPIAELPMFSGMSVRFIFLGINFILTFGWAVLYMRRIRKNPQKSLSYEPGMALEDYMGIKFEDDTESNLTIRQILSFAGFIVVILALVIGSLKAGWSTPNFTAAFMALAMYVAVVNGYSPNEFVRRFINGCKTMMGAALIIGFAGGLPVVLTSGNIMHTIIYWLSEPIASVGPAIGAVIMFWANFVINFFVPSGSGQAAAITPLMIPLADMAGITRQVACQAIQFGDGLSNIVVPTAATIMGCLGLADLNFGKYLKWILPLITTQFVLASIAMYVLQTAAWMG